MTTDTAGPKALFVFDGGDAPGYMAVATALTEVARRHGWQIFAAREGFRSLTGKNQEDGALLRLVWNDEEAWTLHSKGVPTVALHRRISDPGCLFRSERFRGFSQSDMVECATRFVVAAGFDYLVGIGGNGTFEGIRAMAAALNSEYDSERVQAGFINVSADSDLLGDRSVGFSTAVEEGARIARGLFDDAFTHKRIYFLEMMGNRSGKHALHSGTAARAHLIILPGFELTDSTRLPLAAALNDCSYALVVVAKGYEKSTRGDRSASEWLKEQLCDAGLRDDDDRRVIAEPFSRYLRGIRPCALDIELAVLKSQMLVDALADGAHQVMPFVLSEHVHGFRDFSEIVLDNSIERSYLNLIDRLGVPEYREYVSASFPGRQEARQTYVQ